MLTLKEAGEHGQPRRFQSETGMQVQRQSWFVALLGVDHRPVHAVASHPAQAIGEESSTDAAPVSIRVNGQPLHVAPVTGPAEHPVPGYVGVHRHPEAAYRCGLERFGQPCVIHPPEPVKGPPVERQHRGAIGTAGPPQPNRCRMLRPALEVMREQMQSFTHLEASGEKRIALRGSERARDRSSHPLLC